MPGVRARSSQNSSNRRVERATRAVASGTRFVANSCRVQGVTWWERDALAGTSVFEPELRTATDGNQYTQEDFQDYYGGFKEWDDAAPVVDDAPDYAVQCSLANYLTAQPLANPLPTAAETQSALDLDLVRVASQSSWDMLGTDEDEDEWQHVERAAAGECEGCVATTEHAAGRVVSVHAVLNEVECNQLIATSEEAGYKPSAPSGGGHGQTGRSGRRTSHFCVQEDEGLAELLWGRIAAAVPGNLHDIKPVPYFPQQATRGDEFKAVGVSPHLRFYKYHPGEYLLKHDDYRMSRFRRDARTGEHYEQMTFLSLLVYLNQDFEGGRTRFWFDFGELSSISHCRFVRNDDTCEPDLAVVPVTGDALIQDHMCQHDAEAPAGGIKYILRTDVLHERVVPAVRVQQAFAKGEEYTDWTRHYEPSCPNYTE